MILSTLCFIGVYTLTVAHSIVHFKDLGHSAGTAAMFMSILPLAGLVGKAVFGTLGDRIEPRFIWGASMVVTAIGLAIGVTATTNIELYATAILLGAGNAAAWVSMITLVANYYGKTPYASLIGVVFLLIALVSSTVPILAGMVFDHFGSYALAFYPAAAICFLGGLMMPFVRPPVRALRPRQSGG
jgi:MFS family permease